MKKWLTSGSIVLSLLLLFLTLRPISPSRKNSVVITGKVTEIYEGGTKDAVFCLSGRFKGKYYINRALENGLTLEILNQKILGKTVEISYADHWTLLGIFGTAAQHITELKLQGTMIYSEL